MPTGLLNTLQSAPLLAFADGEGGGEEMFSFVEAARAFSPVALVPVLAALGALVCLWLLFFPGKIGGGRTRIPAYIVFALLGGGFVATLVGYLGRGESPTIIKLFDWINMSWGEGPGQSLTANFSFYMDGLSWLWMLFVSGLASMICLYASEYMDNDKGYARFFAAFALFVASMACLVMGDNLVMLYLGWEGVGLCSYLLIGYFYQKPAAVAAAKKAFIVNRIGDLGLALALYLTFTTFGTVEYNDLFRLVAEGVDGAGNPIGNTWQATAIPLLLMVGAFGKSAQLPLYVWLPDAMEGPTPVSALIHAATMVTAGVYLIARMYPLFLLDETHLALTIVGWVGTLTALLAATIGMAQFDIKRIMAYSTVSQLGYMFAGLGVLTTTGAAYHVFTHAFFKATLFLACGAVMHGFAGQLDLRKLSGLWSVPGWRIVSIAMLVGCLNLAGVPLITAGYFSKDMILAEAFYTLDTTIPGSSIMGWILLFTAGLTAYYTFRVFFRVFVGPVEYHPGDEAHDHDSDHAGEESHHPVEEHGDHHADHFHPHAPGWAINTVLAVLAIGSTVAILPYFVNKAEHGWVGSLLHDSSAHYVSQEAGSSKHADATSMFIGDRVVPVALQPEEAGAGEIGRVTAEEAATADASKSHGTILGLDPHKAMYYISAVFGIVGIAVAFLLHYRGRTTAATAPADKLLPYLGPLPRWAQNKWYVDELYEFLFRVPLLVLSHVFHAFDKLIIDGLLVDTLFGRTPRSLGAGVRPAQSGVLHGYATGMACGVAILLLIVWMLVL